MTSILQRQNLMTLLEQACAAGARVETACQLIGLSARCVQRWRRPSGGNLGDQRESGQRRYARPANKLNEQQEQAVMEILNGEEFKVLPPSQIVPRLADRRIYVASESTMYRLLRRRGQLAHRRPERVPQKRTKPRALVTTRPDQVQCWDITYVPTQVRGAYFYLYLLEDLFSRKIVGWQV